MHGEGVRVYGVGVTMWMTHFLEISASLVWVMLSATLAYLSISRFVDGWFWRGMIYGAGAVGLFAGGTATILAFTK